MCVHVCVLALCVLALCMCVYVCVCMCVCVCVCVCNNRVVNKSADLFINLVRDYCQWAVPFLTALAFCDGGLHGRREGCGCFHCLVSGSCPTLSACTQGMCGGCVVETGHVRPVVLSFNEAIERLDKEFFIAWQAALSVVQPSAKREGFVTVPDVTWADVGALVDVREELSMAILVRGGGGGAVYVVRCVCVCTCVYCAGLVLGMSLQPNQSSQVLPFLGTCSLPSAVCQLGVNQYAGNPAGWPSRMWEDVVGQGE